MVDVASNDNINDVFNKAMDAQSEPEGTPGDSGDPVVVTPALTDAAPAEGDVPLEDYTPGVDDLLSDLEPEAVEDEVFEDEVVDEGGEPEDAPKGSRAQKRIRGLANTNSTLVEQNQQLSAQLQQQQTQFAQFQRESQMRAEYNQQLTDQRFQSLTPQPQTPEMPNFEHLPLHEQLERRTEWRVEQKYAGREKELNGRLDQMNQALGQMNTWKEGLEQNAETNKRIRGYEDDASQSVGPLLDKLDSEFQQDMREPITNVLMTWAASEGEDPHKVVQHVDRFLDDYYKARLMSHVKQNKSARLNKGRNIPNSPQSKAAGADRQTSKVPDNASLDQVWNAIAHDGA